MKRAEKIVGQTLFFVCFGQHFTTQAQAHKVHPHQSDPATITLLINPLLINPLLIMHYSRCPTQRTLAVCEAHKRSKQSQKVVSITPRRHLLLAGGAAATTTLLTSPTPALAALDTSNSTALLQSLWDSLTGVQPEAVRYPRKQLDLPFAVV